MGPTVYMECSHSCLTNKSIYCFNLFLFDTYFCKLRLQTELSDKLISFQLVVKTTRLSRILR